MNFLLQQSDHNLADFPCSHTSCLIAEFRGIFLEVKI